MSSTFSRFGLQSWLLRSKYLFVTLSIMIFLLIIPYAFPQYVYFGQLILGVWLGLILLTISFSVYRIKVGGKIALLLICINLFFIGLFTVWEIYIIEVINRILSSITLSFVTMLIFADLAASRVKPPVTSDYLWGGIATYLLIGLTWGSYYHLIELVTPGSFELTISTGSLGFPIFVYFSYYVLTTVGGVLTPVTLQAQSIVMIEPIIGTLYIAILIARLIDVVAAKKREVNKESGRIDGSILQ